MGVTYGPFNAAAALLDDVYVAVQSPQVVITSSANAFLGGMVGCASWGPFNTPLSASTPQQLFNLFGPPIGSGYDLVQEGSLFLSQGPLGGVVGVRVQDGTALKAVGSFQSLALSGAYPGTFGNQIAVLLIPGTLSVSGSLTWKVVVQAGTNQPEVFDNIPQSATPATTWANIIAAINTGLNAARGKSIWITTALSGAGSSQPTAQAAVYTLSGGTDGTSGMSTSISLGSDGAAGSRTGLYALRNANCDQVWLCGNRDYANAGPTLITFAHSELCMVHTSMPTGQSPSTRITNKINAGLSDPYLVFNADDVVFLDSYLNNYYRVPQSCVVAGVICSQSPQQSPGNHGVTSVVNTAWVQDGNQVFSSNDMGSMEAAGIMFLNNPIPSGQILGLRHGKNSIGASNFAVSEIPYGRMTNFLVNAFSGPVMGQFINKLQSTSPTDPLRTQVQNAFNTFLGPLLGNNIINAYSATCNLSNNPPSQIVQGILQADVVVQYLSVVDKFVINLTAGQTVSINSAGPTAVPQQGT